MRSRYMRCARRYNLCHRIFSKIVRLLERDSLGDCFDNPSLVPPAVIRADFKSGGMRKRTKPWPKSRPLDVKDSASIPKNMKHALKLTANAGNILRAVAIQNEVDKLLLWDSSLFHTPDYKPSLEDHWTKLSMVFEVCLVAWRTHCGSEGCNFLFHGGEGH